MSDEVDDDVDMVPLSCKEKVLLFDDIRPSRTKTPQFPSTVENVESQYGPLTPSTPTPCPCSDTESSHISTLVPTPPPLSPLVIQARQAKSKTGRSRSRLQPRQAGVGNVNAGYPACNDVGNDVLSCWPEADTLLVQDIWSKFIWNPNYPTFKGNGYLDIYLYSAASEGVLSSWLNISNSRGSVGVQPDDAWLPTESSWISGQNVTHSYYFVVATQGASNINGQTHQSTFEMIQTAAPTSLFSQSRSSLSGSAEASSISSATVSLSSVLSSLEAAGLIPSPDATSSTNTNNTNSSDLGRTKTPSSLQAGSGSAAGLAHWAIAVIVILGFLTLVGALAAAWLILRAFRRRRDGSYVQSPGDMVDTAAANPTRSERSVSSLVQSERGPTVGMGARGGKVSDSAADAGIGGILAGMGHRSRSPFNRENDETEHNHNSKHSFQKDQGGTDGNSTMEGDRLKEKPSTRSFASAIAAKDAAIISDAFRNVLRKPDFPLQHHSGSSDDYSASLPFQSLPESSDRTVMPSESQDSSSVGDVIEDPDVDPEEESQEDPGREAEELLKTELATEGTSVRSLADRKQPDIRHD